MKRGGFFLIILMLLAGSVSAVNCRSLNSSSAIRQFFVDQKASNPLLSDRISVLLEISSCENETCLKKNLNLRLKNREIIHLVKIGDDQRLNFLKGKNAPQCFLSRDHRDYKCQSCQLMTNLNCRRYQESGNQSRFKGTNIDSSDYDRMTDKRLQSQCFALKNSDQYLKIVSTVATGDLPYNRIDTYVEKKRAIPIVINMFADNRLTKVYRFFPHYYTRLEDRWFSTYIRVRSTLGRENEFRYETIVRVLKDPNGRFHLYTHPKADPLITTDNQNDIFNVNE